MPQISSEDRAVFFGDDVKNGSRVFGTMNGPEWFRVREKGALDKLLPVIVGGVRVMQAVRAVLARTKSRA